MICVRVLKPFYKIKVNGDLISLGKEDILTMPDKLAFKLSKLGYVEILNQDPKNNLGYGEVEKNGSKD